MCCLRFYICSFYAFLFLYLFSHTECLFTDAEILKDILQYHICGNFACDIAEMEDAFTDILCYEVAGEFHG